MHGFQLVEVQDLYCVMPAIISVDRTIYRVLPGVVIRPRRVCLQRKYRVFQKNGYPVLFLG